MKKYLKFAFVVFFLFILSYGITHAQGKGIWANTQCAAQSASGGPTSPCDFCDGVIVSKNIIDILFRASIAIGGLMIIGGGITMMISGGNGNTFKKGKNIIIKAITGVVIGLLSWTIVATLLQILAGSSLGPWNQISCKHNVQLAAPGTPSQNNQNTPPAVLYASIANDGKWACGLSADQIQGAPSNATVYQEGQGYFRTASLCGTKAVLDYPYVLYTAVYAKKLSDGTYTCSYLDCSMPNADPNADCTILATTNQCEGKIYSAAQ